MNEHNDYEEYYWPNEDDDRPEWLLNADLFYPELEMDEREIQMVIDQITKGE